MEFFLISMFQLVKQFGYIVIPIDEMDEEIKRGLGISRHKVGEIVICSRKYIEKAQIVASNLGIVLDQNTLLTDEYGSLILFVTKDSKPKAKKSLQEWIGLPKFAESTKITDN